MKKKQFEKELKDVLNKIKDIPDEATVHMQYFDLNINKCSKYSIENPSISIHMDDDYFETTDNPSECVNLRIDIFDKVY